MDEELVADGRVIRLETRGRASGHARTATVGYVQEPDGSLLVAAGSPNSAWARNLDADPSATVTVGGRRFDVLAEPLERDEHVLAIRALILRYGTPSEALGRGPSYRLRPVVREA